MRLKRPITTTSELSTFFPRGSGWISQMGKHNRGTRYSFFRKNKQHNMAVYYMHSRHCHDYWNVRISNPFIGIGSHGNKSHTQPEFMKLIIIGAPTVGIHKVKPFSS